MKNKGFSLIEMMIAMAVMAILTGALVPQYARYIEKSREARDRQMLDSVFEAVQMAITDEAAYEDLIENFEDGAVYGGIDSVGISFSKLKELAGDSSHPFAAEVMSMFGAKASVTLLSRKAGEGGAEPVIQITADKQGCVSVQVISGKNRSMGVGDGME